MKKICVAGKNNIAVEVLECLYNNYFDKDDMCVICNKNETGINGWQKSLRLAAKRLGIIEVELNTLYGEKDLIFISLEFDQIIKPALFETTKLYNIHFSLLPAYKGMYTSAMPLLNGEQYTGVTLHRIDEGIDTGEIIAQEKIIIEQVDTCRNLYSKYIQYGTKLVISQLGDIINNRCFSIPQAEIGSTYYSKRSIDYSNVKIDLLQTAENIQNQIRAFTFREYQMPILFKREIIASEILHMKSKGGAGKIILENEYGILLSTIDYNLMVYFDRFEELLHACTEGNLEQVVKICAVNAHINDSNGKGWTPLIVAIYNGHKHIVDYLIGMGADIFARSNNGTNCLMYAKEAFLKTGDLELVELFISLGLNPDDRDNSGRNLFDYIADMKLEDVERIMSVLQKF